MMAINFRVGNAVPDYEALVFSVPQVECSEAPAQWGSGDRSNSSDQISCVTHNDFCRVTGLDDLLCLEAGKLVENVSINPLTSEDVKLIMAATVKPDAIDERFGAILAWWQFWAKWAIANCEHPAVEHW